MSDHATNAQRTTTGHRGLLPYGMRALVYIALIAPTAVLAQSGDAASSRFTFEPRFGLWWARLEDDTGTDHSGRPGWISALRLTSTVRPGLRAVAGVAYARLDDARISTVQRPNGDLLTTTEREEIVPVTAGLEVDVAGRRTVLSLGLEAGAEWHRSPVTNRTGPPPFFPDPDERSPDWSVGLVILPGITVRRAMSSGLGLSLSLQAFWDEGTFERGDFLLAPIATVGIRWSMP